MHQARQTYRENQILQAGPVELVRLLYRGAIGAINDARRHVRAGAIRERAESITRASEIVNELTGAVDRDRGGDIARNLLLLYDYIQHLLHDANFRQEEGPLVEAEHLMSTLLEAWDQCEAESSAAPRAVPAGVMESGARVPLSVSC